jgi:MFS family permease
VLNPIWAWLVHGETPGVATLAGGALILGATAGRVLIDTRQAARETLAHPQSPVDAFVRLLRSTTYIPARMPASRARVGVIFFTVLIDLIGFGIVMPILPFYAQRFDAGGLEYGAVLGVYSFMQFVATAMLGKLSDQWDAARMSPSCCSMRPAMCFAFAGSYWMLFLSRVISGFAGGNISVAQAYMADITTPAERSRGMGIVGAAFGIGFSAGPAIGGLADHFLGHTAPGLVAVVLSSQTRLRLPSCPIPGFERRVKRP